MERGAPEGAPFASELLVCGVSQILHLFGLFHQLHIETQALQLTNEYVKGLRNARLGSGFALDDGLIDLGASVHVVRFCGQQFLQNVSGAIRFKYS